MSLDLSEFTIYLFRNVRKNIFFIFLVYGILILFLIFFNGEFSNTFLLVILGLFLVYLALFMTFVKRNPESIYFSLIGSPNSGKTVFLTVFFNEFLKKEIRDIDLRPSGVETTELVVSNYSLLKRGQWLPKTPLNDHFQYRGIASMRIRFSKKTYKIVIEDFAGQYFEAFADNDPVKTTWLHRSLYFKNIVQSDAIFLAIDCEDIVNAYKQGFSPKFNNGKFLAVESEFILAINSILDQNDTNDENKRLHTPLALLFLKFDLLEDNIYLKDSINTPQNIAKEAYNGLITFCSKYCLNFEIFYISSVGHVNPDGMPPDTITPKDITKPLKWAMEKM
jgi:hypothetical protein